MNPFSLLTLLAVLAGSTVAIEGINIATGGEFYLASIRQLVAQAPPPTDSGTFTTSSPPPPSGTTGSSGSGSFQPATGTVQPPQGTVQPPQGTVQPPIGTVQPPTGTVEPPQGTVQPPIGTVQPPIGTIGPPLPPQQDHQPILQPQQQQGFGQTPFSQTGDQQGQQQQQQSRRAFPGQERQPGLGFENNERGEEEQQQEEFVDPREIRQVLREINDQRRQIRQLLATARRNPAFAEDAAKLNQMLTDLARIQAALAGRGGGGNQREAIDEFRENNYWEQLNAIRTKIQLPKDIQQINVSIRRLERTVSTKAVQGLGFDIPKVQATLAEMKQTLDAVQSQLQAGNAEEAQEAMRAFHENGHPGEIEGVIMRVRDIKGMLKRVRDAEIKAQVDAILQEVIDEFNQGNYRDARETLDEYADDLQLLIRQIISRGGGRSNRSDSFSKIKNLEGLVQQKLGSGADAGEDKGWGRGFNPFGRGVQFPPGAFGGNNNQQQAPPRAPAAPSSPQPEQ